MKVYFYKNNKVAGIKVTAPFVWAIAIGIAFGAGTAAYEAFSGRYEHHAAEVQQESIVYSFDETPTNEEHIRWIQKYNPHLSNTDAGDLLRHINEAVERFSSDPHYQRGACQHITPEVVLAVMLRESGAKWISLSSCGAIGLMQIHPVNVDELHKAGIIEDADPNELWDYRANITAGVFKLFSYARNVKSLDRALARYNAGPGNESAGRMYAKRVISLSREIEGRTQ